MPIYYDVIVHCHLISNVNLCNGSLHLFVFMVIHLLINVYVCSSLGGGAVVLFCTHDVRL